jgi:hypothetical protein
VDLERFRSYLVLLARLKLYRKLFTVKNRRTTRLHDGCRHRALASWAQELAKNIGRRERAS